MCIYRISLDKARCISCKACEVHCKSKNNNPVGIKFAQQSCSAPVMVDGKPTMKLSFRSCYHCKEPECVEVCPTGAMIKRPGDGIVYVDQSECIGCMACIDACPWNIPVFNDATNTVMKCDYCRDRVDAGLKPACVTGCTTHALTFITSQHGNAE